MIWMVAAAHAGGPGEAGVDSVLDALQQAATEADADTYFGLFTDDAVFIGTDPTERWDMQAFRGFAEPHFAEAPAWAYTPVERHVTLGPKGRVAWFDEVLDHARYGRVRGSGVLVQRKGTWRVSQYVLSFAIPNAVAMHAIAAMQGTATLPPMFTADQIRAAMPAGTELVHRHRTPDGEHQTRWTVVAATDEGPTIAYGTEGSDAAAPEQTHTWGELRDHAVFPAPFTTFEDVTLDSAFGPLACRRFTVTTDDAERQFWFCPSIAGAPVRLEERRDGTLVREMELVARTLPR